MFNITFKKIGGIRFLQVGRLNLSFSVTSRETYAIRQARAVEQRAYLALMGALAS